MNFIAIVRAPGYTIHSEKTKNLNTFLFERGPLWGNFWNLESGPWVQRYIETLLRGVQATVGIHYCSFLAFFYQKRVDYDRHSKIILMLLHLIMFFRIFRKLFPTPIQGWREVSNHVPEPSLLTHGIMRKNYKGTWMLLLLQEFYRFSNKNGDKVQISR